MSRIGKKLIAIPEKVTVKVADGEVTVQGPLGILKRQIPAGVELVIDGKNATVRRTDETTRSAELHGMFRTLVANMVEGVTTGFKKELDIVGVGYRAEVKGKELHLTMGFSHPVMVPFPEGITMKVDQQTHLTVSGFNRELVGETAAKLRKIRLPEPYKGKGVRYTNEVVRRKVGKAAAGATGAK
jgi:large subunit ribosomal protein L6